jgi:putative membrane protein
MLRWLLAAIHLLALGVGVAAVWMRARALRETLDVQGLRRVFYADNLWALSFALFLASGLWRLLGGLEKGTDYYLHQPFFHAKMGLLALILALEIRPMTTLIRWRAALRRGTNVNTSRAATLARISTVQALLLILMVFAATAMARGISF